MAKEIKNMGASVRARLLAQSKETGQPYDVLLTRFALERLLYRLSISRHSDRFILKGAMRLVTLLDSPHRPTRDLDLLGFGDPDAEEMLRIFREIMGRAEDDGVAFDAASFRHEAIKEEDEYRGIRLRGRASVGGAVVGVVIDVAFGDAVEPGVETIDYPPMLDLPAPRLRAYAPETIIAEKFEAMVSLGRANSRMKDFYDLFILIQTFSFDKERLATAIAATFGRRGTPLPDGPPDALTKAFAADPQKAAQWRSFVNNVTENPTDLETVVVALAEFLIPYLKPASAIQKSRDRSTTKA